MAETIHTFNTFYIAFFRPIKRSYFMLRWNANARRWIKSTTDMPNLALRRSTLTQNGQVTVNVATSVNGPLTNIQLVSRGYYLESGEEKISIVEKIGNQLPQSFMTKDYTVENPIPIPTDFRLWRLANVPPPLDIPAFEPAPAAAHAPAPAVPLKAIPKRIAWLIAEDASKNQDTCPITSDLISPVTAGVTTCFHVFEYEAIQEWATRNPNTKCPTCRERCLITKAFE